MFCYTKPVLIDKFFHVFIAVLRKLICFCTKHNKCVGFFLQHQAGDFKGIYVCIEVIFTQFCSSTEI